MGLADGRCLRLRASWVFLYAGVPGVCCRLALTNLDPSLTNPKTVPIPIVSTLTLADWQPFYPNKSLADRRMLPVPVARGLAAFCFADAPFSFLSDS